MKKTILSLLVANLALFAVSNAFAHKTGKKHTHKKAMKTATASKVAKAPTTMKDDGKQHETAKHTPGGEMIKKSSGGVKK